MIEGGRAALVARLALIGCLFAFLGPWGVTEAAAEELATYRLTIQIHEAPDPGHYYIFYLNQIELTRNESDIRNRTVALLVPAGTEIDGISAYPDLNDSHVSLTTTEDSTGREISVTTDSPSVEVRYYLMERASILGSDDHELKFSAPRVLTPVRGVTTAVNWPNWKFQIHRIEPEGAEMIMNPMFETDPYKSVSYYWYFSGEQAADEAPSDIRIVLRTAGTVSRVNRNQTILIIAAVVGVPTAVFMVIHPPRRLPKPKRGDKRFRIMEEREKRQRVRRSRRRVR